MSLPPALLKKLQQRGIIKTAQQQKEEVYAEAYDKKGSDDDEESETSKRGGAPGCPNKWNQYHLCTEFCYYHWNEGTPELRLGQKYQNDRLTMLLKYPLPENWKEIYDAGMKRHYYWNQMTDQVSWLPPKHPHSAIGSSAQQLARKLFESTKHNIADDDSVHRGKQRRGGRDRNDRDDRREREVGRVENVNRKSRRDESNLALMARQQEEDNVVEMSDRDRLKRAKKMKLDPMDPAAYGDAEVGNWSSGLVSDAKTGADVTASGPLFQSRPYPAPGAIMRKNNPNKEI